MGLWGSRSSDERGVAAPVAVVTLVVIFAGATLSVDAGNLWQSRRAMISGTDAASLAEAGELAFSGSTNCSGLYNTVLERNGGEDVYDRECSVVQLEPPGTGYVVVEARKPVEVRFGVVLGLEDTAAYSMSAAKFGFPIAAQGLRPMAFCVNNGHVKIWRDLKSGAMTQEEYQALKGTGDHNGDGRIDFPALGPQGSYAAYGVVHRMFFNKSIEDGSCGTFPGNWGWLSFDGLPSNIGDRNRWIRNGYSGLVGIRLGDQDACLGQPGSGGEQQTEAGCPPGDSGAIAGQNAAALDAILHGPVPISVFSGGDCAGGGVNCTFSEWAFVGVILRGYKATGDQAERFFDFEFIDMRLSGTCCAAAPTDDLGVRATRLCAADHDNQSIEARCAPN